MSYWQVPGFPNRQQAGSTYIVPCDFDFSAGETNLDSLMTSLITAVEEHNI